MINSQSWLEIGKLQNLRLMRMLYPSIITVTLPRMQDSLQPRQPAIDSLMEGLMDFHRLRDRMLVVRRRFSWSVGLGF